VETALVPFFVVSELRFSTFKLKMKLIYEEMVKQKRCNEVSIRILMRFAFAFMLALKIYEKKLEHQIL